MRSNYKKLGGYIKEVDIRNDSLDISFLRGISSIYKSFMISKANTIGVDFSDYKIVRNGQFAFNPNTARMGDKIPIALNDGETCIVSKIYPVFEITDTKQLLSEYLMMWFRRPEFDRYARFKSHGSAREIFGWEEMCDVEFPITSIEKQIEIVGEYQTIVNRMHLNDQLNQKLSEAAQAIYKHWFVDFEFPITKEYATAINRLELQSKPYKSSGGEMVYCEILKQQIPKEWESGSLDNIADLIDGDRGNNYPSQEALLSDGYCLFLNTGNVTKNGFEFTSNTFISKERDNLMRKGKIERGDVILTTRGTVGHTAYYNNQIEYDHVRINSGMIIVRAKKQNCSSLFIYFVLKSKAMQNSIESFMSGSAQQHLPIRDLKKIPILIPKKRTIDGFVNICQSLQNHLDLVNKEGIILANFRDILLKKMSKI